MAPENTVPFCLPGFTIDWVEELRDQLLIQAHSQASSAVCPICQQESHHVHGSYSRSPRDLPVSGRHVHLILNVRRFRCANAACPRKTFAERLPQVVPVHGQRTHRLTTTLQALAFEVSAEAGARVSRHLNMAVSGDTLLRILRQTPLPALQPVRVLGIDDWAVKKGRRYGTVLVDLEQHRPVDVLPDRTAGSVATWLQAHPGSEIVSRDRSAEYAAGIAQGAPQAIQVADRWHVLKNLGDAVQRVMAHHPKDLRAAARQAQEPGQIPATERADSEPAPLPAVDPPPAMTYRQVLLEEVKTLAGQGYSTRAIARQLHLHRQTVARYRQLETLPKRTAPQNTSSVAPYLSFVHQRWAAGCQNGKQLWRELRLQGYAGSYASVARVLRRFPDRLPPQTSPVGLPPGVPPLSPRQAMWLWVSDPERLTDLETRQRDALCACCAEAALMYPLAQRFVAMIKARRTDELKPWLADARACPVAGLRQFALHLERDEAAVGAALKLTWSNGQVEGQVNRLKLIKRMMYGRANFDLLRLRVLHPP
jgi:transposase